MGRNIIFNVTKIGASHIKSGKPCQDYSLSWESDDNKVLVTIVCDGHGGDTYVRSDRGARLAAEIALRNIQSFVATVSPTLFLGFEGAVTARPEDEEDSLFPKTKKNIKEELTESQLEQIAQNEAFYKAVDNIRQQDGVFNRLFAAIYLQWKEAIQNDAIQDPFNDYEKECLKTAKIVKAYGTTLMAFVRTPLYWFAFHIGDGKLLCCDRNLSWKEPVPWDCNCFLNMTTSLCNSNPIPAFRYAFSGKGDFPAAVIMGSDGLDDSWGTSERLQNFYSQTLAIFCELGEVEALKQLEEYLPRLSEKASRDDMSMAGMIDMDAIKAGVGIYEKQRELKALKAEKDKRDDALSTLRIQLQQLEHEISQLSGQAEDDRGKFDIWLEKLKIEKSKREQKIQMVKQQLEDKKAEKEKLEKAFREQSDCYQAWAENAKVQKTDLINVCEELKNSTVKQDEQSRVLWNEYKSSFEESESSKRQEWLKEKADRMEECNKEALEALKQDQETVPQDIESNVVEVNELATEEKQAEVIEEVTVISTEVIVEGVEQPNEKDETK